MMHLRNTIGVLLFYVLLCFNNGNTQTLPSEEQIALDDLATTLGLQNLSCSATGITCGYTFVDYHVEQINLPQSNYHACYQDKLPGSFFNLQFLTTLNLASNCLWLGDLSALINGSNLQTLDLSANLFTPANPTPSDWWNDLVQLQNLNLQSTNMNTFPKVNLLLNLKTLNLANNQFNSEIPNFVGSLSALESLVISASYLTGPIPESIGNLTNLTSLDLRNNGQLNGSIPDSIGMLTNLESLYLTGNQLSGEIPASISNLYRMKVLFLDNNELSGTFPDLGNMVDLVSLFMRTNQISGDVSSSICNCVSLKYVNLDGNQLTSWPSCWNQMSELRTLSLYGNQINSSVPSDFSQLTKLNLFVAGNNYFYGSLSNSLWNLDVLTVLDLSNNGLSGSLPTVMPAYSKLYQIYLRGNSFTGSVPKALVESPTIRYLDLSRNQLSGDLQSLNFSNAVVLSMLDLSHNQISGQIPVTVTNAPKLNFLGLSYNLLSGKMPSGFEKLSGKLSTLLLDGNTALQGSIVTVLNSLFTNGFGGRVNVTQTGFCCPQTTTSYPYATFAPECYETCTIAGKYGPDCSCDVARPVEGGLCSNRTYRVNCNIDIIIDRNTTVIVGSGGLVVDGSFQAQGGNISVTLAGNSGDTSGRTQGVITITGNVTIDNGTLVIEVVNTTVQDGEIIPVIVYNGTFTGSGFSDVKVDDGDDCKETTGEQGINSTSLVVTMSVQELNCDSKLSDGVIAVICVAIGVAILSGIAGVVFFKQRHNRRLTKLRATFNKQESVSNIGLQVVNPTPLGSVSTAVV